MSSRKSRYQDARAAKDKRMKMIAIGGAVVLAGLLAFELPHYLGHKSAAPPATTSATTGPTATTPTSTVPGTAATALPATPTSLPNNSDPTPRASKSQLFSFDHYASKNPFVQQAVQAPSPTTGSPSAPSSNAPTGGPPTGAANYTSSGGSARTLAQTGAATITVNGKTETVRVGGSFPSANPLFRLVSVANGVARIGIANGSYSSGARTISLTAGRSLTLVDTTDGVRYVLRLIGS